MKTIKKYNAIIWWVFIATYLGLITSSAITFLDEVRSLERLDEENRIEWDSSSHPQVELLKTIKGISNPEQENTDELLDKAFQMDPKNGFIDCLAIRCLTDEIGFFEEDSEKAIEYVHIVNEEALFKAITHFENILKKPVYETYNIDLYKEMRKGGQESYSGMIKDFTAAITDNNSKNLFELQKFLKFYYVFGSPDEDELLIRLSKAEHLAEKLVYKSDSFVDFLCAMPLGILPLNQVAKTQLEKPKFESLIKSLARFKDEKLLLPESNNKRYFPKLSKLAKITSPVTKIPDNYSEEIRKNRLLEYSYYESIIFESVLGHTCLITLGLLIVLLRWKLSSKNKTEELAINYRSLVIPILLSITFTLIYLFMRNYLWSRQFSSTEIIAKCIFISETASFILLSTALPIKVFLNSTNTVQVKTLRNYLTFLPLSLPLILPWILPQANTILLLITLIPSAYILYYFVRSFRLLTNNEEVPWIRFKCKTIITYLCAYGVLILFVYKPVIQSSEAELYRMDKVTKIAIDMGYVCSYTEALTLEYAKQQLRESKTKPAAIDLDPEDSYKLVLVPSVSEQNDSESSRKRRGEILKALEK